MEPLPSSTLFFLPSLYSTSFLFPCLPSTSLPPFPTLSPGMPGHLNPARGSGEHCKLPRQIWAPIMDFGALTADNLVSCDYATSLHLHALLSALPSRIAVWYFSDKNWWYGFKQNEEVLVWHTVPYCPTSSIDQPTCNTAASQDNYY